MWWLLARTGPLVVISAHTMTDASSITVVAGSEQTAELVAFDPASVLALLTAPDNLTPVAVARTVDPGDSGRLIVWEPDGQLIETKVEVGRLLRVRSKTSSSRPRSCGVRSRSILRRR